MKEKSFECDLCTHRSATKGGVTNHRRQVHGIYPPDRPNREVYESGYPSPVPTMNPPQWLNDTRPLPSLPEAV
jgi:hypothetical protein